MQKNEKQILILKTENSKNKHIEEIPFKIKYVKNITVMYDILYEDYYDEKGLQEFINDEIDNFKKNKNNFLIKSGIHYEKQKIQNLKDSQLNLFDYIENITPTQKRITLEKELAKYDIQVKGIDISDSENKAVHSIQTILSKKDYILENDNLLTFTPSEYLQSYGVKKYKHKNGKRYYSGKGRRDALDALISLSMKPFFISYKRKYIDSKKKNNVVTQYIEEISPLINLKNVWDGVTNRDIEDIKNNKNTYETDKKLTITVKPSDLLLDQIETYFVMKPANYLEEIKMKLGKKASKYTYRFIDWLYLRVTERLNREKEKFDWTIKINYITLATNIRLDSYIKNRQWKYIRQIINKSYDLGKSLDYIKDYEISIKGKGKEIDKLMLNPDKFYKTQEIEKKIKELEERNPQK